MCVYVYTVPSLFEHIYTYTHINVCVYVNVNIDTFLNISRYSKFIEQFVRFMTNTHTHSQDKTVGFTQTFIIICASKLDKYVSVEKNVESVGPSITVELFFLLS